MVLADATGFARYSDFGAGGQPTFSPASVAVVFTNQERLRSWLNHHGGKTCVHLQAIAEGAAAELRRRANSATALDVGWNAPGQADAATSSAQVDSDGWSMPQSSGSISRCALGLSIFDVFKMAPAPLL